MATSSNHLAINFSPISPIYFCEKCNTSCSRKSEFERHLKTNKHISNSLAIQVTPISPPIVLHQKIENKTELTCDLCNKTFNSRSGIWRHNKKYHPSSNKENSIDKNENNCDTDFDLKTMFIQLMKQNKELQNQLFEIAKEKTAITNNTINNNNTMNNKFNLQIFLNETCKDAMNIQEFIDFCKVQHSDFENFGKYGYVESMTRIIMRNLMELEVHRRPIHCTDAKREVLYVKDNNVWVNDFSREKLIRAIKYIAAKNVKQIPDWMDHNPDSKNTQTKLHDKYMRMVCHSMGGRDEAEDQEYYKKIIRNVAKEVIIDKMR
jgi:hypothetical protein